MSHDLVIEPLGTRIVIKEGQTILDAALRNGVWLPHVCGHGLCSNCKVEVIEGEVDHGASSPFALMDFEREAGKALACCATALSDVVIEADVDVDPDARCLPVRDFTGTVSALRDLTHDIKGVWIEVEGGAMDFQPGQYINLTLPGVDGPRAYSLAQAPADGRVELHIRRVPGGQASSHVHERLRVGDRLTFTGPYGQFFVRKSQAKPLLFIAGGSGLSSPKSMVQDLLAGGCTQPIWLFHGVRTAADAYCGDLFRELSAAHANFAYVPAVSDPEAGDWDGERGFIHEVVERRFDGKFAGLSAYLCGPPPMIEACIQTLMRGRLFERDIFTERFLSKADAQKAKSPLFRKL